LRLVFLWRGKFFEKMQGMIREHGVQKQVTLINKRVDVNGVLATVHGAVVLAEKSQLVKGFPHSLLESLAAGKPVVLSRCLEMAEYVRSHQCGICVDSLRREDLIGRLVELRKNYDTLAGAATSLDLDCFSQQGMIEAYQRVYRQITGRP
jgi:glycosyltransferase involved in cell wall biosynthesis